MTFTDAAAEVLRLVGRPLHYKEITDIAIEKNLLSHVGKSPEVTMGARLAAMLKKDTPENPLVRVKPGVFALREWDEKTIKAGLEGKKAKKGVKDGAKGRGRLEVAGAAGEEAEAEVMIADEDVRLDDEAAPQEEEEEEPIIPVAAAAPMREPMPLEDEDAGPPAPDEAMRAEAAAGAAE